MSQILGILRWMPDRLKGLRIQKFRGRGGLIRIAEQECVGGPREEVK